MYASIMVTKILSERINYTAYPPYAYTPTSVYCLTHIQKTATFARI